MFRCIYLVVLRRNYTKKVVLFFNQIDNLKLGFDHNKMCDAMFRIKFFLQHFSFKFIRSKLALWQLQGFPCLLAFRLSGLHLSDHYILYNIFWHITAVMHTTVHYFKIISKSTEKT